MSLPDLPDGMQKALVVIEKLGVVSLAFLIAGFFFAQSAGFIHDINRADHQLGLTQARENAKLLIDNQRIMVQSLEAMRKTQETTQRLGRSICFAVTQNNESLKQCLEGADSN